MTNVEQELQRLSLIEAYSADFKAHLSDADKLRQITASAAGETNLLLQVCHDGGLQIQMSDFSAVKNLVLKVDADKASEIKAMLTTIAEDVMAEKSEALAVRKTELGL